MKPKRAPGAPPEIVGFEFRKLLGSGGFADVFLYEQQMPRRLVAVKVLATVNATEAATAAFYREANLMAQLSTHPAIVTLYTAAVADDGRPYIVMEYCPKPHFGLRYRKERFGLPEVLSVGVQIAGAVESAHRAGIVHRDIKPANILVTSYNRPVLSDFGIAVDTATRDPGAGMSVPWSPPEAFASPPQTTPRSDVFSLAATLYTLLASRSPFEVPGQGNTTLDLTRRIRKGELTPIRRGDVPPSLVAIFEKALDPDPEFRFGSALSLAYELQRVEEQLALPVSSIDVLSDLEDHADDEADDPDDRTRVRGVAVVAPNAPAAPDAGVSPAGELAESGLGGIDIDTGTQVVGDATEVVSGEPADAPESAPAPEPKSSGISRGALITTLLALLVTLPLVGLMVGMFVSDVADRTAADEDVAVPNAPSVAPVAPGAPPKPIEVRAEVMPEEIIFRWTNPQPEEGDTYRVQVNSSTGMSPPRTVEGEEFAVPREDGYETCVYVSVVRESKTESDQAKGCARG